MGICEAMEAAVYRAPHRRSGSLERDLLERYGEPCPEAMVESALSHAKILEQA